MNADDEAFLVEFSDSAKLSVGFTSHTEEIQNALKKAQPGGLTAMLDAINLALREMKKAKNSRKAIVIVSDGGDNHSQYTTAQIESLVREADVQIYAMGVFEPGLSFGLPPEEVSGPKLLIGNCDADRRARFLGGAHRRSAERRGQNRGRIAQSVRSRLLPEESDQRRKIPPRGSEAGATARCFAAQSALAAGLLRSHSITIYDRRPVHRHAARQQARDGQPPDRVEPEGEQPGARNWLPWKARSAAA